MRLDIACSNIVDCEHKTAPVDEEGEFFAVGTPAMRNHRINYDEARRISRETFESWTRRLTPRPGDLLLAREAPVGPIVRLPDAANVAPGQRTVLLRPDPGVADSAFLYYALTAPAAQARLIVKAEGSTVHHLNVPDIRSFEVWIPSLAEQQAIAEVLGALDDKIAANTALAATLAQLTSKEFAATVHYATWAPRFDEVAEISGGGTPSTKNSALWDGDIWWATPTDMTALAGPYLESTSRRITAAGLAACSSKLFAPGAILMSSRATIGALAVNNVPTAINQGFIAVEPYDPRLRWWLFHEMESRVQEFISWANGATFLELSRGTFKRLPVRIPEESLLVAFESRIAPLHDVARQALAENRTLAAIRDALLPQLMSGKLRVHDAEQAVAAAGV
ncbi:restriction endonuclease subunit S [uncultured Microbacterium sp.]|uniref:restriction endonuclease subunit S n=1 Tax=uncultured Microbacterium sp. TaxID=191216 RepID=UPI0025E79FA2|nr:restriction endonuclease subunit S [uncultured Microbacterium sp.]